MAWDDYQKPSRQRRRQKRGWKRQRKNRLTLSICQPDTTGSLKNVSSTPALLLRSRFFYAPHSMSRAPARPIRSLGVSGSRKAPDALTCVESTPTPFGWSSISKA